MELHRTPEQLADPHDRGRHVPLVDALLVDNDVARVQNQDVKLLALEGPELQEKAISDVTRTADLPARTNRRELEATAAVRAAGPRYWSVADEAHGGGGFGIRKRLESGPVRAPGSG